MPKSIKVSEKSKRAHILQQANEAYETLQQDPEKWQEEEQEREVWEATLEDGLEELE